MFNNYPYTDFHDINLDEIIKRVNNLQMDFVNKADKDFVVQQLESIRSSFQPIAEKSNVVDDNPTSYPTSKAVFDFVNALIDSLIESVSNTYEKVSNKVTSLVTESDIEYPTTGAVSHFVSENLIDQLHNTVFDSLETPSKKIISSINYIASLIANPNVFFAQYNVANYDEVAEAIADGRIVVAYKVVDGLKNYYQLIIDDNSQAPLEHYSFMSINEPGLWPHDGINISILNLTRSNMWVEFNKPLMIATDDYCTFDSNLCKNLVYDLKNANGAIASLTFSANLNITGGAARVKIGTTTAIPSWPQYVCGFQSDVSGDNYVMVPFEITPDGDIFVHKPSYTEGFTTSNPVRFTITYATSKLTRNIS